jgi:hypothetical protein
MFPYPGKNLHVDRVAVRVAEQDRDEDVGPPLVLEQVGPVLERDNAGQRPPRLQTADQSALVELAAQPCDAEQCDDVEDGGRYDQEVGVELEKLAGSETRLRTYCAESEVSQGQGEVVSWRTLGDEAEKADEVDGPEVNVLHRPPQPPGCDRLSVVHVA